LYQIWAFPSDSDEAGRNKRHDVLCFQDFFICKFNSTKKQKYIKTIPPPNAAIPLVNPILRTSLLCQIWDSPPDYLIEMRQLVSIQNSIFKSIRKLIFPAFGTILVLVAACLYSKFLSKSIQKLIFPAFGTILVLVAACFYSKFNSKKVLQI